MKRLQTLPKWQSAALLVVVLLLLVAGGMLAWLGLRSPHVVTVRPADGSESANPRAPIAIEFDQWMRTDDARQAVTLDPDVPFTTRWQGSTLLIEPEGGLRYATDYRLELDTGVPNLLGRPLDQPLRVSFATVPFVGVEQVSPAAGAAEVATHLPITIEFDRAIVSEAEIAAAADDPTRAAALPAPLSVRPTQAGQEPVAGSGRWLSPSFFGFYPADDLHPATTYAVRVAPELTSDGAASLEEAFEWGFTTSAALVQRVRPFDGADDVATDQPIEVELAAGVDSASAGKHFSLIEVRSGDTVAGQVLTSEDGFVFRPAAPLERGARYEARLAAGVEATNGARINTQPNSWRFNVMGDLAVEQVEPQPGTTDVMTKAGRISVRFNHPVVALTTIDDSADLPQPLTIEPPIAGEGRWRDTRTYVWEAADGLPPATSYTARVEAGLSDQSGGALAQPYEWNFATIAPDVVETEPQHNAQYIDPQSDIRVVFNQPMDAASLRQQFGLLLNGDPVAGKLAVNGAEATFTPATPLERGETYQITIAAGAQSAQGSAAMPLSRDASFRVAPLPRLAESAPPDGATDAGINHSVRLSFSAPMDLESVEQHISIEPDPGEFEIYPDFLELDFYLNFPLQPETDYTITVGGDARDHFGVALGADETLSFRTGPLPSELHFVGANQIGAYNAYTPTRVLLRHANIENVSYKLYPLEPAQAMRLLDNYSFAVTDLPAEARRPLQEDSLALPGERNRLRLDALELGPLAAGLYRLEIRAKSTVSYDRLSGWQILAVSSNALTIKRSADELFVWAIDLDSGDPVADLSLWATAASYDSSGKLELPELSSEKINDTDSDGISRTALESESAYTPLFVWASSGDQFAFATTQWDDGISPWSFDVFVNFHDTPWVGSLHTERPLYRPGQTVHIRGALREQQDEGFALPPADLSPELVIYNPSYEPLYRVAVEPGEFGTFHTDFPIERDMPLGNYPVRLMIENSEVGYGSFRVAEYRKPTFEVSVQPAAPDLVRGEMLKADIEARYFASGPLQNAPVRWRLLSEPYTFVSETEPGYTFRDASDPYDWYRGTQTSTGGELVAEGETTTDAQGRLRLELPTDQGDAPGSRRLRLDVEVSDIDGQVIAAQGVVRVHAGAFYVGVRPEGYLADTGQPQEVSLITLDPQEQAVPNQELEVSIYRREWYSARKRGDDGRFYWTTEYDDTLIETQRATTDERGRASISFVPPEAGSYRIQAEGRDGAGRSVSASAFSWAYGGDAFWGMDDTNRIELIADQNSYEPGDTARILVPAPHEGMRGLLTIERGSIIEHRLITLAGTAEALDIPIRADYAPNVYVSLVLFKPAGAGLPVPDMRVGLVELPVDTEQQELHISIEPDRSEVGPREDVTYTVRATDYRGEGVQAELALALVDKAVLTLADDPNPTLLETFYRERPLGVRTANTLTALVDRVTLRLEPGDKGGGGGGGALAELEARGNMPDTAYWNPSVVTGADGTAQVTLTLPDNLTTWTMTARGLTTDTLVGQERHKLMSTRPLMVRPALPRFLTAGDQPTLQAVVHNNTAEPVEATVAIDAGGLTLDDPAQQSIEVAADSQALLQWQATVGPDALANGAEQVMLRFNVEGGGLRDAVEQALPVQRFVTPEVVASAGQVGDTPVVETLDLPADQEQEGELTIELVPSLAAGVESGLDYLEHYPYGCTEQTVSRFLPNAVTYRLFQQMGLDDQTLEDNLRRNLATGLQRLGTMQNPDGGWGWWSNEKGSQAYLTAYVVQGLREAQRAGQPIDQTMLDDGLEYLESALDDTDLRVQNGSGWQANARAYVLYVLAEAGRPDRGRTIALYEQRSSLHIYGRAYLLMAFELLGGEAERAQTLIGELMSTAIVHPTTARWQEEQHDYITMSSDTRSTALALQALVRSDPDNFLIPNAVRHLMSLRDGGHWRTTQETALTLLALAEYLAASGELEADYTYQAILDGETLREGSVGRDNLDEAMQIVVALTELQLDAPSRLTLQREASGGQSGAGRLYYTLRARYAQEASGVQPLDQGLAVQREYIAVDPVTLEPTGRPPGEVAVGDVVQVRLRLEVPASTPYLVIEDMLPAGLEGLDTSLNTVTAAAQDAELTEVEEDAEARQRQRWWRHITHTEMRDNRVALFATRLPGGSYEYTYLARATTPGTFQTLPATAYQMYEPEVFGRSAGTTFVVTESGASLAQGMP